MERMKRAFSGDQGQAAAEYAIMTFFFVLTLAGVFGMYVKALAAFGNAIFAIIALPVP